MDKKIWLDETECIRRLTNIEWRAFKNRKIKIVIDKDFKSRDFGEILSFDVSKMDVIQAKDWHMLKGFAEAYEWTRGRALHGLGLDPNWEYYLKQFVNHRSFSKVEITTELSVRTVLYDKDVLEFVVDNAEWGSEVIKTITTKDRKEVKQIMIDWLEAKYNWKYKEKQWVINEQK